MRWLFRSWPVLLLVALAACTSAPASEVGTRGTTASFEAIAGDVQARALDGSHAEAIAMCWAVLGVPLTKSFHEAWQAEGTPPASEDLKLAVRALAVTQVLQLSMAGVEPNRLPHQRSELLRALELYDQLVVLQPKDGEVHLWRAWMLAEIGRHEKAVRAFDRAIELMPDSVRGRGYRGLTLLALGRREEALLDHQYVTARADADPEIGEDPEFLRIRGRTLINLNRREDALEVYQEWIRLSPKAVEAYWYKALACRSPEHYQAGLDACERALALDPKSFRLLVEKSWLLRQTKRYDEALRVQDQLLVLSADSGMEFDRGEILRALGRHDEAVLAYDRFSGAYGDNPVVLTKKGLALIELGRFEEARDAFDRALAIRSDYEPAVVARDKLLDAD